MTGADASVDVGGLPGWPDDDHGAALKAYQATVDLLGPQWPRPGDSSPRAFFQTCFRTAPSVIDALVTGYYEPELEGAAAPDDRFRFALYGPPAGLQQAGPWFDRATIEAGNLLAGRELVWLDSRLEAFLAQVQGSVRVRLQDGTTRRFGFAGKNGQPYSSIGKELIRRGALAEANASVAAIREWAAGFPGDVDELLRVNRSFVFFRELELPADLGPLGTMQRPVTPLRSIAVDPDHIPLGAPVWVEAQGQARLMIAQDTGSAIKGPARADIFFGTGAEAGLHAGAMKAVGRMTALLPKGMKP